ncbi:MAG: glycine--tRNA ligase [Clostridia bacterium]|jgi:glycyl-tRNA synthetase|nr:glycine--tRNA ligase [Clostridia bacterium]HJJ09093.1 glycine--tRNA ligase [Clostridiaceae bacterium]
MADLTMDKIVSLCKNRGFIFQGSEIYGGLANTWDYGPLGARLKNSIKDTWRKRFVQERKSSYEIDADILMHPRVWEASGHVAGFSDPLLDCKECKTRHRADNLISDFNPDAHAEGMTQEEMLAYINENKIPCPKCGKCNFTDIRQFNLMFQTYRGVTNDSKSTIYLRPENAQGEYVNFLNVQRSTRAKLPFSIAQIGKAFRNEITPGNFIFRTIEFEQMEFQTFCKEGSDEEIYNYFKEYGKKYYMDLGLPEEKLRFHDHEKLVFYAKAACDIEYLFPSIGWGEINGTHNRTNYDLSRHQEFSGIKQEYLDPETNEKFIPYIIESTYGLDRTVLAVLCQAYEEEEIAEGDVRTVLHLHPAIAPYKMAILPLSKKLSDKANDLYTKLSKKFMCDYDEAGSIGKRYRRQDEVGTPYCITVDFDTLEDNTVTIRDRDTMEQIRININEIENWMKDKFDF